MANDDPRRAPLPPPHVALAPEPWLDERDLPFLDEPGPDRACGRCGREDRRRDAELFAARDVLGTLEELLDWLRGEHAFANRSREEADREAQDLRLLLTEFHTQAGRYERVIDRARRALGKARAERDQAHKLRDQMAEKVDRYERYVAALEGRLKKLADAPEPSSRAERGPIRPLHALARRKG